MGHGASKVSLEVEHKALKAQKTIRDFVTLDDFDEKKFDQGSKGGDEACEELARLQHQRPVSREQRGVAPVTFMKPSVSGRIEKRKLKKKTPKFDYNRCSTLEIDGVKRRDTTRALEKEWTEKHGRIKNVYDTGNYRLRRYSSYAKITPLRKDRVVEKPKIMPEWRADEVEPVPANQYYPFDDISLKTVTSAAQSYVDTGILFNKKNEKELEVSKFICKRLLEEAPERPEIPDDDSESDIGSVMSNIHDVESTKTQEKTQTSIEIALVALDSIARKWNELSQKRSQQPSKNKFSRFALRPLLLHMLELAQLDKEFCILEHLAKTKIIDFVDIYLRLIQEKLDDREILRESLPKEAQLLKLVALTGCLVGDGLHALERSGWDSLLAFQMVQKKKIPSKLRKPAHIRSGLEYIVAAVKENNMVKLTEVLPICSQAELTLGLTTAISVSRFNHLIIKTLLPLIDKSGDRKIMLLAASRGMTEGLRVFLENKTIEQSSLNAAIIVAAKRGFKEGVELLTCVVENDILCKALIAAASADQYMTVRFLAWQVPEVTILRAIQAVKSSKKQSSEQSRTLRLLESWASFLTFRNSQQNFGKSICTSFFEVEQLLSSLRLWHKVELKDKFVVDLRAGVGETILGLCLAQPFKKAVGYELNVACFNQAEEILGKHENGLADLFLEDDESINGINNPGAVQDISFKCENFLQNSDDWVESVDLVIASKEAVPTELIVESLKSHCLIAYYGSEKCEALSKSKYVKAMCKVKHRNHTLLWTVYQRLWKVEKAKEDDVQRQAD